MATRLRAASGGKSLTFQQRHLEGCEFLLGSAPWEEVTTGTECMTRCAWLRVMHTVHALNLGWEGQSKRVCIKVIFEKLLELPWERRKMARDPSTEYFRKAHDMGRADSLTNY